MQENPRKINFCPMLTLAERAQFINSHPNQAPKLSKEEQKKLFDEWFNRRMTLRTEDCFPSLGSRDLSLDSFATAVSGKVVVDDCPISPDFEPREIVLACQRETQTEPGSFSFLIRPFVFIFAQKLSRHLRDRKYQIGDSVFNDATSFLSMKLVSIGLKTFIQDLHETKDTIGLDGKTPQDRLVQYFNRTGHPSNLIHLYLQYPVLYKRMAETTSSFLEFVIEMLERFRTNTKLISDTFFPSQTSRPFLTGIHFGQGDTHQHGKMVVILETNSGKLVYKPRDLTVEIAFRTIEGHFHSAPDYLPQRHPKHLHGNGYAFVEFIDHVPCDSLKDVKAYYHRYGELIALMFLCNGTDMHYENIIAHGKYPVIVDIETLFNTPIKLNNPQSGIVNTVSEDLRFSVGSSLMLPKKTPLKLNSDPVDLSGLAEKQITIKEAGYAPTDLNSDQARFAKADATVTISNNKVLLGSAEMTYRDHIDSIIAGFSAVASYFLKNRHEFIELIDALPDFSIRILARDTHRYARLLDFTFHPACMKDYSSTEKVLENLFSYPYEKKKIAALEYNEMLNGDIPLLLADFSDDSVLCNDQRVNHSLSASPKDYLLSKLHAIDDSIIEEQVSIIRMSCQGVSGKNAHRITLRAGAKEEIDFSDRISADIIRSRLETEDGSEATWRYVQETASGDCSPAFMPVDFYDGMSGVLFFLSAISSSTKRQLAPVFQQIMKSIQHPISLSQDGGYVGLTSVIRLISSGLMTNNELREIEGFVIRKIADDCQDIKSQASSRIDYLTGLLGQIKLYCDFAAYSQDSWYLQMAEAELRKHIAKIENNESLLNCCGIGHGVSGLLVSLGTLYKQTNDRSYLKLIERFNRILSDIVPDCNRMSWCRGSIGALLSQSFLLSADAIPDLPNWFGEAEANLDSWKYSSDEVCHGSCGRIQYYLDRFALERNPYHLNHARELVADLKHRVSDESQIRIYEFDQFTNVGLFTGLAGVGYTILRAEKPGLPSILI